jgi:serine protease inhibitor
MEEQIGCSGRVALDHVRSAPALELVEGNQIATTVILPAAGRFEEVQRSLGPAWLAEAAGKMDYGAVVLRMPKLKLTYGTVKLKETLERMGMPDAFSRERADFSGIVPSRSLYLDNVYHKASFAVDESGTEASVSTAVEHLVIDYSPEIHVDRPFIFLLRDTSGAVLFAGHVMNPLA